MSKTDTSKDFSSAKHYKDVTRKISTKNPSGEMVNVDDDDEFGAINENISHNKADCQEAIENLQTSSIILPNEARLVNQSNNSTNKEKITNLEQNTSIETEKLNIDDTKSTSPKNVEDSVKKSGICCC